MLQLKQYAFWWIGLGILALGKFKHMLNGYTTPRAFSNDEIDESIHYVRRIVDEWSRALSEQGGGSRPFEDCQVLELGPGPDLGVGVTLLSQSARGYAAMDINALAIEPRDAYYERLMAALGVAPIKAVEFREAITDAQQHKPGGRIQYVVRPDFDLQAAFTGKRFNRFVSQAAFEHFDDIERTIADISALATDDALLVFGIDFKTHGRWIREDVNDPLNIYRYSDALYRLLTFRGSPNRKPLSAYLRALEANGWVDIRLHNEGLVDATQFAGVRRHLHPRFRDDELRYTWVTITASRPGARRSEA